MPDYNIKKIDLSLGTFENKRLELDQDVRTITVLTRGGLVYVAPQEGGPWIPLRGVGQSITFDAPIRTLFYKHSRGSGVVELLVSGGGTCVGFSGGGASAVSDQEVIIAHIAPRTTSTGGIHVVQIYQENADASVLGGGAGGDGTAQVTHQVSQQLNGLRLNVPAGAIVRSQASVHYDRYSPPILSLLNPGGSAPKVWRTDWFVELRDLIYCERVIASAADEVHTAIGFGYHNIDIGAFAGQSVSLFSNRAETVHQAVIRDVATGYLHRTPLTGFPIHQGMYDVAIRIGVESGGPYARWFMDGQLAHEVNLPLAAALVMNAGSFNPFWFAGRYNGTSADSVQMWAMLGGGAVVRHVIPAAA